MKKKRRAIRFISRVSIGLIAEYKKRVAFFLKDLLSTLDVRLSIQPVIIYDIIEKSRTLLLSLSLFELITLINSSLIEADNPLDFVLIQRLSCFLSIHRSELLQVTLLQYYDGNFMDAKYFLMSLYQSE